MSYSLNEIEALSKRAARGGGLSWGMAEEAAKATRWLASHNLPGAEALADLLDQNDGVSRETVAPGSLDGTWTALDGPLCPLASGAVLNDCADRLKDSAGGIDMTNVSYPLLVVPFAAWAALHIGTCVSVTWGELRVVTDGIALLIDDPESELENTSASVLRCTQQSCPDTALSQPHLRGTVSASAWQALNALAQRTYAPATEASRRLGAGAGASDND